MTRIPSLAEQLGEHRGTEMEGVKGGEGADGREKVP